jgi:hypothetical protein
MGNTCASLHIAWRRNVDEVTKAISRSYGKLGYERLKKAPPVPEGGKHVILRASAGQSFISIYDSENALLDNGELKDLALAASKALKTAAVFTSLYDSDRYEFIVFANGRQVDLLMTDAESYAGPLKRLTDKSRVTQWTKLFGRTLTAGQIEQASAGRTVFADDAVARLSELIGLPVVRPLANYQDCLEEAAEVTAQLYFTKKPAEVSNAPAGEIRLANAFDPDDSRVLLIYPASWPFAVGKATNVKWLILSQGAGFSGGTATIRVSGPDAPVLSRGAMRGFKFHNGQIVGDLETFPTDKGHVTDYFGLKITPLLSESGDSQLYRAEFPNVIIPPMTPGRTTQILIVLVLYDLQSQTEGEWEINVSLQPGAQTEYRHHLPAARIAAVEQSWLPVVSGLNPRTTYRKTDFSTNPRSEQDCVRELQDKQSRILDDRLLIHPAISSSVAILKDGGQATLDACKTWIESWLRPLAEQGKGEIRIYTEKKLPPLVFKANKTKKNLSPATFFQDKAWGNLFIYANSYQSALIAFFPENSERAVAGIGLQYSHERDYFRLGLSSRNDYEEQMARTLSVMRDRPFPEEEYRSTLHAFKWVTHRADCYEYLSTSVSDMEQQLDSFAAENAPLQAWSAQSTWVPLFDQAGQFGFTVYEKASALNWFRGVFDGGGLYRRIMSAQWCSNVLRMVTTHMWLCRELVDQVNRAALEQVAKVTEMNGVYRIELHPSCALDELELALLPILPVESARLSVS